MMPSCSKPMMRFTTLVNPNTAYTGTEETAAENVCPVGDSKDGASTSYRGLLPMFFQEMLRVLSTQTSRLHLPHTSWSSWTTALTRGTHVTESENRSVPEDSSRPPPPSSLPSSETPTPTPEQQELRHCNQMVQEKLRRSRKGESS